MMRDQAVFESTSRVTQPQFWGTLPARWDSDTDDTLVCCQVRQETHDVKSFFFRAPGERAFVFEPGQFITLELEIDGETINRCYTISSPPTRPHTISITVKRVPGGKVSNWLHDNLRPGSKVRVLGPSGEFTCARHPARKFLFLSAGSGVTPLMSMSRAHHELGEDSDIMFVHSARTPDDIIFARELDLIASNQANFRTAFVCERVGARTNWPGITGFLTLPLLKLIAPDFLEREIFTCGPAPYMKAVRDLLDEGGFDRKHYHEESFSFETIAEVAAQLTTAHVADALQGNGHIEEATVGFRARAGRDEVQGELRQEQSRDRMRQRPACARRREESRRAARRIVHAGHVRHLQGQAGVGRSRHEACGRNSSARNRSGHGAAVLQQAVERSRRR